MAQMIPALQVAAPAAHASWSLSLVRRHSSRMTEVSRGGAASHTYDGYSKWDAFDVDAALREVDRQDNERSSSVVRVPESLDSLDLGIDRGAEPKEMLDAAISRLQKQEEGSTEGSTELEGPTELPTADAGETTAHKLSAEYQKWDEFEDMDELDEVEMDAWDSAGMDLNALTGPAEEVKQIQAHWKREATRMARSSRKSREQVSGKKEVPLDVAAVQERPCVLGAQSGLEKTYSKWKSFDADAALLELDNEDTTEEGKAMRLSAGQGSAMLNCEGYTKDREEYDLDQDIERNMGDLKKILAQNFKDASALKVEGNDLLRSGQVEEAKKKYREGLQALQLSQQASVLLSPSLSAKQSQLVADLFKNLAAAQMATADFSGALASADEALKVQHPVFQKAFPACLGLRLVQMTRPDTGERAPSSA